jgi:hypothetical protein
MLKMSEPEEAGHAFSIHTFADERPTVVMVPSVRRVLCIPMLFEGSLQTVGRVFGTNEVRTAPCLRKLLRGFSASVNDLDYIDVSHIPQTFTRVKVECTVKARPR